MAFAMLLRSTVVSGGSEPLQLIYLSGEKDEEVERRGGESE